MSESLLKVSDNSSNTVVEEINEVKESFDNNMAEIVDHVKMHVIQEKIKDLEEESNNLDYSVGFKKHLIMSLLISLGIVAAPIMLVVATGWTELIALELASLCGILGFFVFGTNNDSVERNKKINAEIVTLRKELVEQSFNMDIIEGGSIPVNEWKKFVLSPKNEENSYQRYLKIEKNSETGFEEVLIKKIVEG